MAADLGAAYAPFRTEPPVVHGIVEARARNGDGSHIELWVDWPAFRIEKRSEGENVGGGELVIATEDGTLFGYRDGKESFDRDGILGRSAIHIGCSGARGWDGWVDEATGLRLRYTVRHPDEIHEWYVGYVELAFNPSLEPSAFDPRSV
jgi:hypothetical protein